MNHGRRLLRKDRQAVVVGLGQGTVSGDEEACPFAQGEDQRFGLFIAILLTLKLEGVPWQYFLYKEVVTYVAHQTKPTLISPLSALIP